MTEPVAPNTPPTPPDRPDRVIRSDDLFRGARQVLIEHGSERYRLIITRNDKLILQK